jgi:hypothetical protein
VVFLDPPRLLCVWRILWGRVRDRGKARPDLPAPESFDWDLVRWTWTYPHDLDLPNLVRLRSRRAVAEMIRSSG